ncbi:sugar phosphate permease [Terriglobus roseus DSM 18391]|uniref:Sugar phosphate permease n=1 Tax=Terriglobus roseus (strain DSM 18391 / NRRL B-41598 / KBS 63) TaxID=926566 RepID=I3ZL98_TERRK|nr:MFS transporter [Terriglobus roseus]AFL90016.1 sugar phosphate permease [Terriglobus roseus DSM 18391]
MLNPAGIGDLSTPVASTVHDERSTNGTHPIRWLFAGLLLLASVMNYIDRQTLSVLAVTVQHEMKLTDVQYGYVVQCFLLTYMVMYVVSGRLVDRYGARRTQGVFLLSWSLANALTGFATGFVSLMGCRAMLGAAEPGNYTASLRAVNDWFSAKQRALAVGIYSMGGTLGAAIAVPLTTTLALRYGWRSAFVVTGAMGAVIAVLWLLVYRDPPRRAEQPLLPAVPWKTVLRQPLLLEMLGTRMLTDSVWYFFLFWISKYLQESRGFTLAEIGASVWVLFVGADLGALGGGAVSGLFVARHGLLNARLRTMLPAAICMFSLAVVPTLHDRVAILSLLTLLAACHMVWMTNVTTLTLDLYPRTMATTIQGLIGAASSIGGLISAGLIAHTIQTHGYRPVFLILALMHPIAATVLFIRLRPLMRRTEISMEKTQSNEA